MNANLRRFVSFVVSMFLFSAVTAAAEPMSQEDGKLWEKAVTLTNVACEIYPAIEDIDQCVDKVTRGILAYRTKTPEQLETLMSELQARASARRQIFAQELSDGEQLHQRELLYQLMDAVETSCALPPVLTDLGLCMDKVYHGILSSRDPHSRYMNKEEYDENLRSMAGDLWGIGVNVTLTEDKLIGITHVIEGSPAEKAGVLDGDRIVAVVNGTERFLVASAATPNEAAKKILGKPNTEVTLEILRGEAERLVMVRIVRAYVKLDMVKTKILADPNDSSITYAYVKIVEFGYAIRKEMIQATKDILAKNKSVRGIIFDVRGNPGGVLDGAYEVVDALVDSKEALVSIRTNNDIHAYGTVRGETTPEPQPGDITRGLPMTVLIDRGSASAAEMFAGSLKELDRAVIIGKGTWQKGTVQRNGTFGKLDVDGVWHGDGSGVAITQSEYLIGSPAKWVAVQCVGVVPDIVYEMEVFWKPKKEQRECDLPGVIVSGGARSAGNPVPQPLLERDPARYRMGEEMLKAVKVFDHAAFLKSERIRKLLKITAPKEEPEDTDK